MHNVGGTLANTSTGSDFFCSYDAVAPGGYRSDGPFNQLRITRNGHTIVVDGFEAPRCEPTGFIQPGDHIYVDGRNQGIGPQTSAPYGYTTTSVGDPFHC